MARVLISKTSITGEVKAYAGTSAPEGYLFCQGQAVSRTAYSDLFSVLGISHGQGDGITTFNLPDYRGQFLRGRVDIGTSSGSGTVALNNATFTNHGINRTGFRVRYVSGILTGISNATNPTTIDYFAIVVDSNTLAFATTQANALAGTKIAISGANSAIITQFEDPDASSRIAPNVGGNSGGNLGSVQVDALQNIDGAFYSSEGTTTVEGAFSYLGAPVGSANPAGSGRGAGRYEFHASSVARTSTESRPKNSLINYIIKY